MNITASQIRKILIIQFKPFGDVLLTTSYLGALKESFPEAKIDFLVSAPYHAILNRNPYLSRVIVTPKKKNIAYVFERLKLIFKIRACQYDLVIDQQNGTGSGQVTRFSKAKYRLGYEDGKWSFAFNLKAPRGPLRYSASRKFDILRPLGIEERPYQLHYHVEPDSEEYIDNWLKEERLDKEKIICFSPGSPVAKKQWSKDCYARLADLLIRKTDCKVVFLWAPNEYLDVLSIESKMREKPVLAPHTSFNEAAAFLKKCALLVCNDGGINHLSVAVNAPALAVFGATSPEVWSAEGVFENHYHLYNPDADHLKDKTFGIKPEQVFEKILEILGRQ